MRRARGVLALAALAVAAAAAAQQPVPQTEEPRMGEARTGEPQTRAVTSGEGAVIRALDKISGETTDLSLALGERRRYGRLSITLGDCRYPTDDPASEAYAWLEIRDPSMSGPAFSGWMLASSPALHAMDHPRYDIWVLRCSNS